jgi:hypothetical protein
MTEAVSPLSAPGVELHEPGDAEQADRKPEAGAGLCLSGGATGPCCSTSGRCGG